MKTQYKTNSINNIIKIEIDSYKGNLYKKWFHDNYKTKHIIIICIVQNWKHTPFLHNIVFCSKKFTSYLPIFGQKIYQFNYLSLYLLLNSCLMKIFCWKVSTPGKLFWNIRRIRIIIFEYIPIIIFVLIFQRTRASIFGVSQLL